MPLFYVCVYIYIYMKWKIVNIKLPVQIYLLFEELPYLVRLHQVTFGSFSFDH